MMKRMVPFFAILLIAVLTAGASAAQEKPKNPPPQDPPQISKEFHDEIIQLLDLIGSRSLALQYGEAFNRMLISQLRKNDPQLSQKEVAAVKEETAKFMSEKLPELIDKLVPVYAKHFTREEVKELIAFYKTPVGGKTIKELPLIANESLGIGNGWGQGVMPDVQARVNERLKKDGYQPIKVKPAPPEPEK